MGEKPPILRQCVDLKGWSASCSDHVKSEIYSDRTQLTGLEHVGRVFIPAQKHTPGPWMNFSLMRVCILVFKLTSLIKLRNW